MATDGTSDETFWEKTRKNSKVGFDKLWNAFDKLGAPVNKLSNKLGSEAFWPTTLDRESDKAARILRSFCKDGFYDEEEVKPADGPTQKQRVLKKIPKQVIEKAVGLCIFTTMRTGLWVSGSGGSGVLVARQEDGSWSPPSGVMLHTAGLGFLVGVDIYDCVIVINNRKALEGFTKVRLTLGGEISAVAGPAGIGGIVDSEIHARQSPLFTYMKSRGFYAGVQIDGTILIERTDENERFYGEKLSAAEIVSGVAKHPPLEIKKLQETLKAAEGKENVDEDLIPTEKAPADYEIEAGAHVFGVPDQEDPDPYGVHALQSEGLQIKEAGTKTEPQEEEFEFKPSLKSPVHTTFQPAINAARQRRNTVTSLKSPSIGSSIDHEASSSPKITPPKSPLPTGPLAKLPPEPIPESVAHSPPALPSRDDVAKVDDTYDIAEEKTDAEHFDHAGATPGAEFGLRLGGSSYHDSNGREAAFREADLSELSLQAHKSEEEDKTATKEV